MLCWNCRGLGNPRAVHKLRRWSLVPSLSLVFVSETVIAATASENLKHRLGLVVLLVWTVLVG